ncbi:MAG: HAD family hydrolase [Mesoflavibacter sp.]|nr:HAD family hydrolase [Mesoflavibacter sp.]
MRKQAILIDLDNTIIDTAVRKINLLKDFLPKNASIAEEKIRHDYELNSVFGSKKTEASLGFFSSLDSEDGILKYEAPLFHGVKTFLKKYSSEGISILILTGRPDSVRNATLKELEKLKIDEFISEVFMVDKIPSENTGNKPVQLKEIIEKYDVIASIGDRLEDYQASKDDKIPFLLFKVTPTTSDVLTSFEGILNNGGSFCHSWNEIDIAIETIIEGRKKLNILRETFTQNYSSYLSDIDNKCRITTTISGILATLSGKMVIDKIYSMTIVDYLLVCVFALSVFSLLYSIQAMTSRSVSGHSSGEIVLTNIKQWIATLIGWPTTWQYKTGDAIDSYNKLKKASEKEKARAHYDFFVETYNTYDPESLSNLRLFQLRAANWAKVYAERIASKLLIFAITLILIWLVSSVLFVKFAMPCEMIYTIPY